MRNVVLLALAFSSAQLLGCGNAPCGGHEASTSDWSPVLKKISYLGNLTPENFPVVSSDPYSLFFSSDFTDRDGDLGGGMMEIYLRDDVQPAVIQHIDELFRQSGLGANAIEGEFWISLRFGEVNNDSRVRTAFQAIDAGANRSNCYEMDIAFDVLSSYFLADKR